MATYLDLDMISKNSRYIKVTLKNADLSAYDLTGKTVTFTVKENKSGSALITKTSPSGGITIINAAGGIFQVTIDPADTNAFNELDYYHETKITNGAEVVSVLYGRLRVKKTLF